MKIFLETKNRTEKSSKKGNWKQNGKIFLKIKTANGNEILLKFRLRKHHQNVYLNARDYRTHVVQLREPHSFLYFNNSLFNNLSITCILQVLKVWGIYNKTAKNKRSRKKK